MSITEPASVFLIAATQHDEHKLMHKCHQTIFAIYMGNTIQTVRHGANVRRRALRFKLASSADASSRHSAPHSASCEAGRVKERKAQLATTPNPRAAAPVTRTRVDRLAEPLDEEQTALIRSDDEIEVERASELLPDLEKEDYRELVSELQRVRDELESTIHELHSGNEAMKAAHEEAISTKAELETSKGELQSLNEELITVNTQLQLKMEELEATTNELSSLLSSTSIAVIFLDTQFRVRRFTPAINDLIDLIPTDIGRPVNDLARKFSDETLLSDARQVLDGLMPLEREITSVSGRNYMRRILPYRALENRIEGVVITFVDIPERTRAERKFEHAAEDGSVAEEGWHVRKNGAQFWGSGMLGAVRNRDGELQGFVKVLRDNTDNKVSEEAVRQAKFAADAANEAKDNFLANVSHELRTPLSAILLWSQLLLDQKDTLPEKALHALSAISRSAEEQRVLIEDLVDTSRIAAGKMILEKSRVVLGDVVRTSVASMTAAATAKQITLRCEIENEACYVEADSTRIQQVVSNLLGNAIKFTNAGGNIWLALHRLGHDIVLTVRDDGMGVAEEFLPHVFERFAQSHPSRWHSNDGMGLGLAIVHHIVELHGGTVKVESAGVGQGTTFTVRLRVPTVASVHGQTERHEARQLAGRLIGVRILLVEDIDETRFALEAILNETGAATVSCETAACAIEAFERLRPHIILSDLGLPDVDGFELIDRVRAYESSINAALVPAVALTAFAGQNIRRKALESGFQLCITKPIQPVALLEAIESLISVMDLTPTAPT
jgi:two-component system CheB/CheR fusion protein